MNLKTIAMTAAVLSPLVLAAPWVSAEEKHAHEHEHEHRQHGTHVHGVAALNIALEGDEVHVELDSPAANIVGFEHAPSSEADHAALDQAVARLKDGDALFRFNAEAGCKMEMAKVSSALLAAEHGEHEGHKEGDHGHAEKGDHDHERHAAHGHDEHEKHAGETHSDIDAAYHFECAQPGKLSSLTVELFEAFPATGEIEVQYVIENRQGAVELTPSEHVVNF
ncbi:MAG: DUF2796 domain-containing protein [Chromatiales bacterium]|nr:DUF2796 domain-containing protein [Gammaproteobacteria bacterium]MCP5352359.1 DUF2796 domain-containing protein [Chromatiales bacterium]